VSGVSLPLYIQTDVRRRRGRRLMIRRHRAEVNMPYRKRQMESESDILKA